MSVEAPAGEGGTPPIRVEAATPADLEAIVALHLEALPPAESLATAFGPAYVRSAYRWLLTESEALLLVARQGGRVLGYTSVANGPYTLPMLRHGWREAALGVLRRPRTLLHPDLRARLARALSPAPPAPPAAQVVFTAVAGASRGLGIARALKEASVTASRAAGWPGLLTAIHDGNAASIRLNEGAGFRELPALRTGALRTYYLDLRPGPDAGDPR